MRAAEFHELAHVWLGSTGLSNPTVVSVAESEIERWCNPIAAELLVPLTDIRDDYRPSADLTDELARLARRYKVSTLVVLRRIHDTGSLSWDDFRSSYQVELDRLLSLRSAGSGGNFYNTQPVRASKRFTRAVITSTLEGETLHRDAFQLLGFKKCAAPHEMLRREHARFVLEGQ